MTTAIKSEATYVELQVNGQPSMRFGSDTSGQALSNRNILINAGFRINNGNAGTPYVSGAVLASGAYGHEMWKANSSGGDYTFTQLNTNTQITIATNKSLIQVVEDLNVHETSYVLSWEGTARARVGVNTATPSGVYADSPILVTGQTAGTAMSVEFTSGTLSKPQLEKGTIATPFENRSYGTELALTQRYYEVVGGTLGPNGDPGYYFSYKVTKRTTPTITWSSASGTLSTLNSDATSWNGFSNISRQGIFIRSSARL